MGITAKLQNASAQIQTGMKNSTLSVLALLLKVASTFFVALTVSLLSQFMIHFGTFGFLFVLVVVFGSLLRLVWPWMIRAVVIFDVICFLIALICHLYVELAPTVGQ